MRVQVLILLRFSYPSLYNKRGEGSFDSYRSALYDPERLRRRMVWFEHVVLASLATQTDPDFRCVMLVGDDLPEPFKTELAALCSLVPQIKIAWTEEGLRHRLAIRDLMGSHADSDADLVAEMQLDDDDAIGRHIVAETRAHAPMMATLVKSARWAALDFVKGLVLQMGPDGHQVRVAACPLWTPGLMTFRKPHSATMIRRMSHLALWKAIPVVSLPTPLSFVRGAHEDNASNFSNRWERFCLDEDPGDVAEVLETEFGIDLAAMQADRSRAG